MTDKRLRRIQELKKHRIRVRRLHISLALIGVFAFIVICFKVVALFQSLTAASIELTVANAQIMQGEALPAFSATAKLVKAGDKVLDKKSKYTALDFVNDLKSGKGYKLDCEADPNVEGVYQIKAVLEDKIAKKISGEWKKRLNLTVKNGR